MLMPPDFPCLVWKSTTKAREQRSWERHEYRGHRRLIKVSGMDQPAVLQMSCIETPDRSALEAATLLVE